MRNKTKTSEKGVWVCERSTGDEDKRRELFLDFSHKGKRYIHWFEEGEKLYLRPNTVSNKTYNKEKIRIAAGKRSALIEKLKGGEEYIQKHADAMLLKNWFDEYLKGMKNKSIGAQKDTKAAFAVALMYAESRTTRESRLSDVDKDFILGYVDFLRNTYRKKNGQPLSESTVAQYFQYLGFAMKKAFKRKYIPENPYIRIEKDERPKDRHEARVYLNIDEVQRLIDNHCGNDQVKRAFLFSCFCGLRLSDIRNLTWGKIEFGTNGDAEIVTTQQKTKDIIRLPLPQDAIHYLPERGAATDADRVFKLPAVSTVEDDIEVWRRRAGISKHVTFHTARHTFATMMLTLGTDIYTTSKLLGHANIQTTQIYAEIINSKKQEGVKRIEGHFTHNKKGGQE